MRVLVTGGAGFIGSWVCDRLLDEGHEVVVADDMSGGNEQNLASAFKRGARLERVDIRDEAMKKLLQNERPDAVCHLAAQVSVSRSVADPSRDASINIMGLLNVAMGAQEAGVRKLVFASSGGAMYGEAENPPIKEGAPARPSSPYGISKRVAEHYVRFFKRDYGLDFTSLALANIYGPRQDPFGEAGVVATFSELLVRGETPTINGHGDYTRDYTFVDDVARAFVLACEKGSGETFHIGTGIETSVNDLFKVMADVAGFTSPPNYGPPRPGDVLRNALDPSKAAEGLGWKPQVPLRDGIARTLEFFRNRAL